MTMMTIDPRSLPNPEPGNGYHMTNWAQRRAREHVFYVAKIYKLNVFPPPKTGVIVDITIEQRDIERYADRLPDIIAVKIEAAIANCEYLIAQHELHEAVSEK